MKIPMVGEVNNKWAAFGGATFVGVLGFAYYRKHKQSQADAASLASASAATQYADTSAATDPYADSYQSGGYGGVDLNTGVPYAYEAYSNYGNTQTVGTITTNSAWVSQAESDAQNLYGATYTVAVDAVEKFMAQSPAGLPANEYTLMQSVLAELGQPPERGPYRLIQARNQGGGTLSGGNPPSGGITKTLTAGEEIRVETAIRPPATVATTASRYGIAPEHLILANPGLNLTPGSTNIQVWVPYRVVHGDTLVSIAAKFQINPEHLAEMLTSQGLV